MNKRLVICELLFTLDSCAYGMAGYSAVKPFNQRISNKDYKLMLYGVCIKYWKFFCCNIQSMRY